MSYSARTDETTKPAVRVADVTLARSPRASTCSSSRDERRQGPTLSPTASGLFRRRGNVRIKCIACIVCVRLAGGSGARALPRFPIGWEPRHGRRLRREDGTPVADLKQDEIEILEDNRHNRSRLPHDPSESTGPDASKPDPATRRIARGGGGSGITPVRSVLRYWHVSFEGSAKAAAPFVELLNRVIGARPGRRHDA